MTPSHDSDAPDDGRREPVSKTLVKKQMQALQKMGESLIELPIRQYNALDLPPELRAAVDAARGMNKRGALHRQRQFIGRVMREIDAAPLAAAIEQLQNQDRHATRDFHRVEKLRDRLLDGDDANAFTAVCEAFPQVERQSLRHKVRAARSEATTGRPAGAKRALFRFLNELLHSSGAADS